MGRLFGTDGVRGVANRELTPELAFKLGKAACYVLKGKKKPTLLIGRDTRISGHMLENALAAGIMAVGGNVVKLGVIPTPAVAYLTREYYKADAGIVISASHNSFEYNGIKIFRSSGYKLDDLLEEKIEDIIISDIDVNSHIIGTEVGACTERFSEAWKAYGEYLLGTVNYSLTGKKLVIDCANGAAVSIAPEVFGRLGAEVSFIGNEPDGCNINKECGSTHPEKLSEDVIRLGADMGLAFDGDADRLIVVDDKGKILDGDKTIVICAKHLKDTNRLKNLKVTATVMSNIGFHKALGEEGISVDVTQVGDRYVLEKMLETGCKLGGEQSGHIIFSEYATTGDGILSALQLIEAVLASGRRLSELSDEIAIYPQILVNAKINNDYKSTFNKDAEVAAMIKEIEDRFKGRGRVLIRTSGTEPLVRVMLEGQSIDEITEPAKTLAALIEKKFGV